MLCGPSRQRAQTSFHSALQGANLCRLPALPTTLGSKSIETSHSKAGGMQNAAEMLNSSHMPAEADAPGELRVLVVDDNVDAATSLSYLLQLLGCTMAVAFGGVMALRVAQLFQPAVVFVDLEMPGPDGYEVLAEAKKLGGPIAGALFVCLTGRGEATDERRCLDAGFDRFVTKPMAPEVLREILMEARQRASGAMGLVLRPGDQPPT